MLEDLNHVHDKWDEEARQMLEIREEEEENFKKTNEKHIETAAKPTPTQRGVEIRLNMSETTEFASNSMKNKSKQRIRARPYNRKSTSS